MYTKSTWTLTRWRSTRTDAVALRAVSGLAKTRVETNRWKDIRGEVEGR